jgi:hypothetical protein
MAKIKYQATFADGTVLTRSSYRGYTHAWRLVWSGGDLNKYTGTKGFAASAELAHKAATPRAACFDGATYEVAPALVVSMKTPASAGA